MISGDSSCSDSGLEVRGSSRVGGGGGAGGGGGGAGVLRALYRSPRVEGETESHTTDYSPSPHSSILDAPLPPSLVNIQPSVRIQQNNAVR